MDIAPKIKDLKKHIRCHLNIKNKISDPFNSITDKTSFLIKDEFFIPFEEAKENENTERKSSFNSPKHALGIEKTVINLLNKNNVFNNEVSLDQIE